MKQRYDSYKPSGIDWIREVPSHWTVMPLKRQGIMNTGLTFTKANLVESGDAVISYGQIHSGLNDKVHVNADLIRYIPKSISKSSNSALVGKGDFIFADTSEDLEGCGNAVYVDTPNKVYAGYHTIVLKRNDENGKFLAYLFQTDAWRSQIRSQVSGVKVYSVTQTILASTSIILPPIEEQKAIAEWLDAKCGEIDAAIAKVDREIELIDELKQSEISRVVTRGLNPDAPLRPSGIDWIGDVPEHWMTAKLGRLLDGIQDGTHGTFNRVESGYPLLSAKNVFEDGILISENESYISSKDYLDIVANGYPKKGDIALCCVATIGRGCIYYYEEPIAFQRSVTFLRINSNYSNTFILYYLRSIYAKSQFDTYAKTSAQSGVYMGDLKKFIIAVPPLAEQREIADYLDRKCAEIDGLKEKLKCKRETLVELRQSLISEVVTGKRKVI